jgi:hypothetical protein
MGLRPSRAPGDRPRAPAGGARWRAGGLRDPRSRARREESGAAVEAMGKPIKSVVERLIEIPVSRTRARDGFRGKVFRLCQVGVRRTKWKGEPTVESGVSRCSASAGGSALKPPVRPTLPNRSFAPPPRRPSACRRRLHSRRPRTRRPHRATSACAREGDSAQVSWRVRLSTATTRLPAIYRTQAF